METELILGFWSPLGIFLLIISIIFNFVKTIILTRLHNSYLPDDTPIIGMGVLRFFTNFPLYCIIIFDGFITFVISWIVVWSFSIIIPFIYKGSM